MKKVLEGPSELLSQLSHQESVSFWGFACDVLFVGWWDNGGALPLCFDKMVADFWRRETMDPCDPCGRAGNPLGADVFVQKCGETALV